MLAGWSSVMVAVKSTLSSQAVSLDGKSGLGLWHVLVSVIHMCTVITMLF